MESQRLDPEKIGTPFQLLAAAMVFVVLLDGTLLSAAAVLEDVPGASMILVIAAVAYPPVLLSGLFVLQTRYRDKLLGDDAFLRMEEGANELRDSLRASGRKPERWIERLECAARILDLGKGLAMRQLRVSHRFPDCAVGRRGHAVPVEH